MRTREQWAKVVVRVLVLVATLTIPVAFEANAEEPQRVAIVIGNNSYQGSPLSNPINDAQLIAETLRQLDFRVLEYLDVNQKEMKRAIKTFGDRLELAGPETVGLFYYAGHAVQLNGRNYLIPIDAEIDRESDVDIDAVSADTVLEQIKYARNSMNIVVMDASRNNPYTRQFRSPTRGLARMNAPQGTVIAYATSPDDVALGGEGENSLYSRALAKSLLKSGLVVEQMFRHVRQLVIAESNGKQVPWEMSSLTRDFSFDPLVETTTKLGESAQQVKSVDRDVVFWQSIEDSENKADFEAYLRVYPKGAFEALALNRLETLTQTQLEEELLLAKQQEAKRLAKLEEELLLAKQQEAKRLAKLEEELLLAKQQEAKRLAKLEEELLLAKQQEAKRLAKTAALPPAKTQEVSINNTEEAAEKRKEVHGVQVVPDRRQLPLPEGFFPKWKDKQAYAAKKVQRLGKSPSYFKNKPEKIAEALAYFEFIIDKITRPNNFSISAEERQKYLETRKNLRSKIGIHVDTSPSVAIATLYAVGNFDPESIQLGGAKGDIAAILAEKGLAGADVETLSSVFGDTGDDNNNIFADTGSVSESVSSSVSAVVEDTSVFSVGDAMTLPGVGNIFSDVSNSEALSILGLDFSSSFSDAVAAYNNVMGTNLSVEEAKEALGISEQADEGFED
jgi:hypothetical protein